MAQVTFSPEQFKKASALLRSYYGLRVKLPRHKSDDIILIETSVDTDSLECSYDNLIGNDENGRLLKDALVILSWYVKSIEPVLEADSFKKSLNKYARQDLLRMYVFFNGTIKNPGGISLRSKEGSVRLANCCNWIWEDMVKDYLKKNLPDINSVEQACKELISGKSRRGRRPNDKRVPVLLWGSYRMLSDKHGFKSSMPNCLCEFIIVLLQVMGIFSQDTEIDAQWVRAQLRYIKSRPQKPSFSQTGNQSSIMKGAQ